VLVRGRCPEKPPEWPSVFIFPSRSRPAFWCTLAKICKDAGTSVVSRWDIILLAISCYIAITALVRLMRDRRNRLEKKFQAELAKRQRQMEVQNAEDAKLAREQQQEKKFEEYIEQKKNAA